MRDSGEGGGDAFVEPPIVEDEVIEVKSAAVEIVATVIVPEP